METRERHMKRNEEEWLMDTEFTDQKFICLRSWSQNVFSGQFTKRVRERPHIFKSSVIKKKTIHGKHMIDASLNSVSMIFKWCLTECLLHEWKLAKQKHDEWVGRDVSVCVIAVALCLYYYYVHYRWCLCSSGSGPWSVLGHVMLKCSQLLFTNYMTIFVISNVNHWLTKTV